MEVPNIRLVRQALSELKRDADVAFSDFERVNFLRQKNMFFWSL